MRKLMDGRTAPFNGGLLSLEIVPAGTGLTVLSASMEPGNSSPPKLKVKKLLQHGAGSRAIELSLRPGQVASKRPEVWQPPPPLTWPLVDVPAAQWVPYESLLRGILTSHPFNFEQVSQRGIALRLTKANVTGISFLKFNMQLTGQVQPPMAVSLPEPIMQATADSAQGTLQTWEVYVQLGSRPDGSVSYTPIKAERKEVLFSTVTVSSLSLLLSGNESLPTPLGYESSSMGIAQHAESGYGGAFDDEYL